MAYAMVTTGSDCPTGKHQYATKADAIQAACAHRSRVRSGSVNAFRCAFCDLFHVGNKGGDTSKGRRRR